MDTRLISLDEVQINDDGTSWIHAMPIAEFKHAKHGLIKFTAERIQRFADNVNAKIRGVDLDIDYDHKALTTEAAGWVRSAQARDDGLWLFVEWTKDAVEKIKAKKFRYFSPEYVDKWTAQDSGTTFTDVLFGGGITNRPFLRGLAPINLSEILNGGNMSKELAKLYGLPEDADEATILAKAQELLTASGAEGGATSTTTPPANTIPIVDPNANPVTPVVEPEKVPVAASEAKVSDDPVVKAMAEEIAQLKAANRLSEIDGQLVSLSEGAEGKFAIAPSVKDKLRDLLVKAPKALSEDIFKVFSEVAQEGLVPLGEVGDNRRTTVGKETDHKAAFLNEVIKVQDERKLSYRDAAEAVSAEKPQLLNDYMIAVETEELTYNG